MALAAAAALSPSLALVLATVCAAQLGLLAALYGPLTRLAQDRVASAAEQEDRLLELLAGVQTSRAIGERDGGMQRWVPAYLGEIALATRQERWDASLLPALGLLQEGALAFLVAWGAALVLDARLSLGTLVAFQGIAVGCTIAMQGLSLQYLTYVRGSVYLRQLREAFQEPVEQAAMVLTAPGKVRGRIELENVSFHYESEGPAILREVSLAIEPGTKVALVGRSGSGKSTLGRLLLGLHLPTGGRVLFDGRDAAHLDLSALRRQIGVVLQEVFLFGASIRQNLTLTAPGASMEEVEAAARKASIHDDIAALPMAYETLLAEGAATLSGGQRQRLAIARALVHQPAILLLDEATSALDNITQAAVERSLSLEGCTRVVIAHRLSTVRDADLIVVLEGGRIVEQGTHCELMTRQGAYFGLARDQLFGPSEPKGADSCASAPTTGGAAEQCADARGGSPP
jgi:ABC-type bacteriocin/lantibiotic exporter with double-glycine peptidase domain